MQGFRQSSEKGEWQCQNMTTSKELRLESRMGLTPLAKTLELFTHTNKYFIKTPNVSATMQQPSKYGQRRLLQASIELSRLQHEGEAWDFITTMSMCMYGMM